MLEEIQEMVERGFSGKKIVVIGDLMLDKYLIGEVGRVSPEAPVPVLQLKEEKHTLGGAGNVALNLKGLDVTVFLISVTGKDREADMISHILSENGLSSDFILSSDTKPTITKTRIVGENQQIVRVDKEDVGAVGPGVEAQLLAHFDRVVNKHAIDAVIISDYAKGVITETLCQSVIEASNKRDIPALVDPKGKDFSKYKKATILMPNEHELSLACNGDFATDRSLEDAGRNLYKTLDINYLIVTMGEKGILLIDEDHTYTIPTRAREVFDVSGAGDTVIALAAAGLAVHLSIKKALELANLAAGYVVSKFGTHPITYAELKDVMHHHLSSDQKQFIGNEIADRLIYWRNNHKKVVFTNGCFDIIHAGHIHLLQKARQQGDKLIVGINSDASVRRLKGEDRPVNSLKDRMRVLEAISWVDAIIPFSEATPLKLIKKIMPDTLVKGADYKEDEIVGAKEVKANGGKIVRVPLLEGKSTTRMIMQDVGTNG